MIVKYTHCMLMTFNYEMVIFDYDDAFVVVACH